MPLPANIAFTMKEECVHIMHSPDFRRSPVMSRLLEFLVDFCVNRDSRGPKAYTVAVEGLGRNSSFDPNIDSYPRVQVGRLRKMIAAYYADHPRLWRLQIPIGHYQVQLIECDQGQGMLAEGQVKSNQPHQDFAVRGTGPISSHMPEMAWALLLVGIGATIGVLGCIVSTSQ